MTSEQMDNLQHMLDPVNPMSFLLDELRKDWLELLVKLRCDVG